MSQVVLKEVEQLEPHIRGKKLLLVRGGSYSHLQIRHFFERFDCVEFTEFTPNPSYEQVCEGVKRFQAEGCDMVVAVGGGSAMDVAKCIKLYCKMGMEKNYLEQELFDTEVPLIAMPTTAGSGSEATRYAVIYYEGKKQSVAHDSILPDYVVLESSVLKKLPIYQKKCTMMDALCQAIESWWSVKANEESKSYARKTIVGIRENWRSYIEEGTQTASMKIMEAANYSGRAINITATTAAHAMSYKLTSLYGLPHGHAVALCMVEVWKYNMEHIENCADSRSAAYLAEVFRELSELIDYNQYCKLLEELQLEKPTSVLKEQELEKLAESVNALRLKNNPVTLSEDVIREMYERIVI